MKALVERNVVVLLLLAMLLILIPGNAATSKTISYDYSAKMECLSEPDAPHYNGGLLRNPGFDHGFGRWRVSGNGKTELRQSTTGNKFIVAHGRNQRQDSFSHKLNLEKDHHHSFSAWVQVSHGGNVMVNAAYRDVNNKTVGHIGSVLARSGCWSLLKGGFTLNSSMPIEIYFESENTDVELWIDSVSLQPFTKDQWRDHRQQSIEKIRKRKVRILVSNQQGHAISTNISLENIRPRFPLGCVINAPIRDNQAYQAWIAPRFTVTTFGNEMKWYHTERSPGQENYSDPDAMVAFAKTHGIAVRGHNIFWDDPEMNLQWAPAAFVKLELVPVTAKKSRNKLTAVTELVNSCYLFWLSDELSLNYVSNTDQDLMAAARRRLHSLLSRYSGDVIAWDVINENLHYSFFEDRLGPNASAMFFNLAHESSPNTLLFMNEYNTLEYKGDGRSTPAQYLQKIKEIKSYPGNEDLTVAIGLEGHFGQPDMAYVRASLDFLGASGMPIWITELDVKGPNQAAYLEEIMREVYSHPTVQGIIVWAEWPPKATGCNFMCLTDEKFKNLPAGDVVDKLIAEWKTKGLRGKTDSKGIFELNMFHGEYLLTVSSSGKQIIQKLDVPSGTSEPLNIRITA